MTRTITGVSAIALITVAGSAFAQDLIVPQGEGDFAWAALEEFAANYDFTGETLNVTGATTGDDAQRYRNLYAYFEQATGATVEYSGSESFEQDIVIASQAGGLPDVALFPQPGLAKDLAAQGALVPVAEGMTNFMVDNYAAGESWKQLATFPGADGNEDVFGLFFGTDVKSLVWYVPEQFEEAGYDIPETQEELMALSQQIVEDGGTPWCIGLGSGAATGWPATDWVEDMMLRTASLEDYDRWVSNDLPFNDPIVVNAIEQYGMYALTEGFADGGPEAAATTDFRDSPDGLFDLPPKCYMHKQASFIPIFFPEGVEAGTDVEFFYFPPFEANSDLGRPVLGSGGLASVTNDRPITTAFMEFLGTPIAHELMMTQGQFLSPHVDANLDIYTSDVQRALGEILTTATSFRFDGSDLMPGEIGTNAFWTGMVDYTTGADAQSVADAIQSRWNEIK
ncbi:alpha-glucoside ABC transporter substrate-binding protein [Loktanella sp. 3ANDIMAR09]|uniref:ABC transporter substrate-binding protein n=1 Tax=Loktanella sp. 3ANDIMAR09 TaxID=1225657 RepID=UPI0006F874FC|nr:ABC transporter substrate-binding protein [Loktanella sp. 3ANDIMAR09]KQI69285.1 alpha-glucoside ABC transporter substrate-binding protein [Loktanella sp. 3ANDIMAR09]